VERLGMRQLCNFVNVYTKRLLNVYVNMAATDKKQTISRYDNSVMWAGGWVEVVLYAACDVISASFNKLPSNSNLFASTKYKKK